jgi:type VII ESX secretion system EccE translocon-like protein
MADRLTYRFGPVERRGIFGAARTGQVLVLGLGLTGCVAILDAAPSIGGAFTAGLVAIAAVAVGFLPLGRRTADEWGPIAIAFAFRRLSGSARFRSRAPTGGSRLRPRAAPQIQDTHPDAPGSLSGIRILDRSYGSGRIGVISARKGRWLTAVLACRVLAFALLDPEAQERRLARWGLVLSSTASTAVRRIQWLERTAPAQVDELARWLSAERDPAIPLRGTPMVESYLELIGTTARVSHEHEILMALQIDSTRVRDRGRDAAMRALVDHTERLAQGLEAAEVSVLGALTPGQVARVLRTGFDPFARAELATLDAADPRRDGIDESGSWPLGTREGWDHYASDGALHATFWIGAWPRVDVSPMFMNALLGRCSAVRTVAVTFEPISTERSTREVEAAVTRDRADRELRHRIGQSETARRRQAQEATLRRESELAAGHGEVRMAGFVTVSGRDPDDLNRACAEVLEHAARARLELHRMYGQQPEAFTFTLPLCRGLR